jgi:hypothetical protein
MPTVQVRLLDAEAVKKTKRMGKGEILARARHGMRINPKRGIPVFDLRQVARENELNPGQVLDDLLRYGDVIVVNRAGQRWAILDEL